MYNVKVVYEKSKVEIPIFEGSMQRVPGIGERFLLQERDLRADGSLLCSADLLYLVKDVTTIYLRTETDSDISWKETYTVFVVGG